jgi:hypothetical protein
MSGFESPQILPNLGSGLKHDVFERFTRHVAVEIAATTLQRRSALASVSQTLVAQI